MSTCAILVVRDEADVIGSVIRHLLWHVDEVIVEDHLSIDGTREILEGLPVELRVNDDPGFWQAERMTALAAEGLARGHEWAVACDGDEIWDVDSRAVVQVKDFLAARPPSAMLVKGRVFDYRPSTVDDQNEPDPVKRIGYRERMFNTHKVACRLRPDLRIETGNHHAVYDRDVPSTFGLLIRHYTFRTEEQFLRKVKNGRMSASVEAGMPAGYDSGWGQWIGKTDDEIVARFRSAFWSDDPAADASLIYDPAR